MLLAEWSLCCTDQQPGTVSSRPLKLEHPVCGTGAVQLLTRTGLDWTRKYPAIAAGVASLGARPAHLAGELCSFLPDGITSSGLIQTVPDAIDPAGLEYFIFELLHLDGEDLCPRPRLGRSLTRFLAVFGLAGLRHCDRNRLLAAFHLPARPLRRVHKNCFFCGVPMVRIHLPPAESPSLSRSCFRGSRTPAFARLTQRRAALRQDRRDCFDRRCSRPCSPGDG